ncbi:E3 ubiquitin-protein ligase TRIM35-like [Engraulis encrasicolus]|uniref:E3 ubiquitin-protein ligase TRIM35-like n=1 Tax=Engraulis encrasicolus TaxID=184585 RepID=UPI002FCF3443
MATPSPSSASPPEPPLGSTAPPEPPLDSTAEDDALVLQNFLVCQICQETFRNPVSLACNHSFCKTCLFNSWGKDEDRMCPVCETALEEDEEEPEINLTLQRITDEFLGNVQQDGESPPQTVQVICNQQHKLKPTWYCKDDDRVICESCESIHNHSGHNTILIEDMVRNIKDTVSTRLDEIQTQLTLSRDVEESYLLMSAQLESESEQAEQEIREEFEQLHDFLRIFEEARKEAVKEEVEEKKKIIQRELKIAEGHVLVLAKAIARVQRDLEQDDHTFLKDSNIIKARVQCKLPKPQVMRGAVFDLAKHTGNLRFQIWDEIKGTVTYFPVLLDQNTADGWLDISDDWTLFREIRDKKPVADNPERFTKYIYVLGTQGFSSGQHGWEVVVGRRRKWSVGVAAESVERKDETFLEPRFGFWTVWMDEENCTVGGLTFPIEKKPQRIRIQLDYEEGRLAFYDSHDKSHIYTYKTDFEDETVYPFFSTETEDSEIGITLKPFDLSIAASPTSWPEFQFPVGTQNPNPPSEKTPSENSSSEKTPSENSSSENPACENSASENSSSENAPNENSKE